MNKPLVYIASPYTQGQVDLNVHFQLKTFNRLMRDDLCIPVAPLWAHFQHLAFPLRYERWIEYSLAIAERCDICLRLAAEVGDSYYQYESAGADKEVQLFLTQKKPVYFSVRDLHFSLRSMQS